MKVFNCQACGQLIFFENVRCEHCGRALGYLPGPAEMTALAPQEAEGWTALADPISGYKYCKNYEFGVCNWLVPADDEAGFCTACRHNRVIPDLALPGNDALWARIETAKRRLFYSLLRLGLPLENRADRPDTGLAFDFLADPPQSHAAGVMTGHDKGLITLALKEADDAERERVRTEMGEPYRTLLGHFRHESGHYFWDRLISDDQEQLEHFRVLFGDERTDYAAALQAHYDAGPPANWQNDFVSTYATTHPWEDFAETWAHYLHIADTLETASEFGVRVRPRAHTELAAAVRFDPYAARDMDQLVDAWLPISFAMNSLNRAMGHGDLYPFVLSPRVIEKLGFVHALMPARTSFEKVEKPRSARAQGGLAQAQA